MRRRIGWFSWCRQCRACWLAKPDKYLYCDTGSEHEDNDRFRKDCETAFGFTVDTIRSDKYDDTWHVWMDKQYLSGIAGAPCTSALKVQPRLEHTSPDDVHIFGYTDDPPDRTRADRIQEHWPELQFEFPLIERNLSKLACRGMLAEMGVQEPVTYAMGFPNANCIPCVKATSARYWSLVREEFPKEFERMASLARDLDVKLARLKGERVYIDEIPDDHPVYAAEVPVCDFMCQIELGD